MKLEAKKLDEITIYMDDIEEIMFKIIENYEKFIKTNKKRTIEQFYYDGPWKLIASVISNETVKGPNANEVITKNNEFIKNADNLLSNLKNIIFD